MKTRRLIVASVVVACCMAWVSAYGGDETNLKGLITGRTSDNMTVRTSDGTNMTVVLTDDTKYRVPKGLGFRKATNVLDRADSRSPRRSQRNA